MAKISYNNFFNDFIMILCYVGLLFCLSITAKLISPIIKTNPLKGNKILKIMAKIMADI